MHATSNRMVCELNSRSSSKSKAGDAGDVASRSALSASSGGGSVNLRDVGGRGTDDSSVDLGNRRHHARVALTRMAYRVKDVRVGRIVEHDSVDASSPNVRVIVVVKTGNLRVGATRINGADSAIVVQDDKNPIHLPPGQTIRCGGSGV